MLDEKRLLLYLLQSSWNEIEHVGIGVFNVNVWIPFKIHLTCNERPQSYRKLVSAFHLQKKNVSVDVFFFVHQ